MYAPSDTGNETREIDSRTWAPIKEKCCANVHRMKELPYFTYYALLALSAMGLLQAAYLLFFADKEPANGGPSPFSRPEAPDGYRWVLMLEEEADKREEARRNNH